MQISLKWIQELLDIETVKLDNLVEQLTLTGVEVEEKKAIEKAQKALALDKSLADLETLKKNLWGHRLLVEAEKLIPLSLTQTTDVYVVGVNGR